MGQLSCSQNRRVKHNKQYPKSFHNNTLNHKKFKSKDKCIRPQKIVPALARIMENIKTKDSCKENQNILKEISSMKFPKPNRRLVKQSKGYENYLLVKLSRTLERKTQSKMNSGQFRKKRK